MIAPQSQFGRYRIDALAAVGGMGAVYRATDEVLERPVALKVLQGHCADDPDLGDRLARESLHAAQLSHPHVVTVYDAGEVDGQQFVAMRWVEGRTLEAVVEEGGPLPPATAVRLVEQIAAALDHAHGHGLVHRDVKPDNVMVDEDGNAFLMDFGLGKRVTDAPGATMAGEFLGTADYAAPEQIEGRAVDARTDVYGLGGLAFRCLTGQVPFEREGTVARLFAHVNEPAPSLRELRDDVPEAVDRVVRRALAKAPEERFSGPLAFADALRAAVGAEQGTAVLAVAPPPPLPEPRVVPELAAAAEPRPRRRFAAMAAAAVVAAVMGVLLSTIALGGGGTVQPEQAEAGAEPEQTTAERERVKSERRRGRDRAAETTTATPATASRKDERKRMKDDAKRDRRDERSSGGADGGLTGAGESGTSGSDLEMEPDSSSSTTASSSAPSSQAPAPSPSAQPAPAQPQQPQQQPAQTTPAQTEAEQPPAETQPSEPPPAETQPPAEEPATTTQPGPSDP